MVTNKHIRREIERYRPKGPVRPEAISLAKSMAVTSQWHIDKACAFVARALGSELVGSVGPDWVRPKISNEQLQEWDESYFRR